MGQELTLRETQLASLEVLRRIVAICDEQQFRYYIAYGTLIGAVRHGGFIPWDDDVDIQMPRPDYDAFLSYCDEHADELMPLVALRNTEARMMPYLITRVSDATYRMVGEAGADVPEMGAFVDVYPLDGVSAEDAADPGKLGHIHKDIVRYLRAANFEQGKLGASAAKLLAKRVLSTILGNPRKWEARVEASARALSFDGSDYVAHLIWMSVMEPPVFPRRCYDEFVTLEFEGLPVHAPAGYDEVLRIHFGDYMQLPPAEEQVPHHRYSIVRREQCDE